MKTRQFKALIFLLALYSAAQGQFQFIHTTGVGPNQQLLPVLSDDDDWEVQIPNSASYQKVKIGHCIPNNSNVLYPCITQSNGWTGGWLSPHIDPVTGKDLPLGQVGIYRYKYTFYLPACGVVSASIHWGKMFTMTQLVQVYLNGTPFSPPSPKTGLGCGWGNSTVIGGTIRQAALPGKNELVFEVVNTVPNGYVGFRFQGDIWMNVCEAAKLQLVDRLGLAKSQFCIDEPVFIKTSGANEISSFKIRVEDPNNNFATNAHTFKTDQTELKKFLAQNYGFVFQPNVPYKIVLEISSACGSYDISTDVVFNCCSGSPDPGFSIAEHNGQVKLGSVTGGLHQWELYSMATDGSNSNGPFQFAGSDPTVDIDLDGPCYLVKHTVINSCGTSCTSRKQCTESCVDNECSTQPPFQVTFNSTTKTLSWPPVTGAASYVVSASPDACCGGSATGVNNYDAGANTSMYLNLFGPSEGAPPAQCYAVIVTAKCSNGQVISASNSVCIFP